MGSGASKQPSSNNQVISPRVQVVGKGKNKAQKVVLDSVPLSDVGSGTIRYRHETPENSVYDLPEDKENIPVGYFYHPKLEDYSELGNPDKEETYKFIRVLKGPKKLQNVNVMYATGIGFAGTKDEIPPALIANSPDGLKRIYGHKYFSLSCEKEKKRDSYEEEDFLRNVAVMDAKILIKMTESSKILDVKRKLSQHLICPVGIIHLGDGLVELSDDDVIRRNDATESDEVIKKDDVTDGSDDVIIVKCIPI